MKQATCECSLIVPTHNRHAVLGETLERLLSLSDGAAGLAYETIVVDNGSTDETVRLKERYPTVRWIELGRNIGAAARNVGAAAARGRVLVMLDDDSWPADGVLQRLVALFDEQPDVGAAACRVRLADWPHRHDAGGVPGIFFNCGGAVRRQAFLEVGGYPIDFDYYVEEYDLCCRLWQSDWRVEPRGDLLVWHRRVTTNRDNNRMLRLLVRNNLRLWHRYAPPPTLDDLVESTIERYRRVALKENAMPGYLEGLAEGRAEIADGRIRRTPLSSEQLSSLFGLDRAGEQLQRWTDKHEIDRVAVWSRGKGCEQLLGVLASLNIAVDAVYDCNVDERSWRGLPLRCEEQFHSHSADGIVVGSLSPGVAEDLCGDLRDRFPTIPVACVSPWQSAEASLAAASV